MFHFYVASIMDHGSLDLVLPTGEQQPTTVSSANKLHPPVKAPAKLDVKAIHAVNVAPSVKHVVMADSPLPFKGIPRAETTKLSTTTTKLSTMRRRALAKAFVETQCRE